jgi:hypothetical protein
MKWMTGIRMGFLLLLGMGLSACAADGTPLFPAAASTPYPPPGFTHMVESSHVALYWNCSRPEPGALQLAGVAVNPWSDQPVRFLEFTLVGVDTRERTVSEAKAEARDFMLRTHESSPFQLDLRTAGSEARFDLYYQYQFQDRGHSPWVAEAAWDGPSVLADQPILLAWTTGFMVRDACSESQHRVR